MIEGAFAEVARGPGCALGLQLLLFATLAQPKSLARTIFKAPKTRPPSNANFPRFFSARLVATLVCSLRRCLHLPRLSHPPSLFFLAASFTANGADVGVGPGYLHPQRPFSLRPAMADRLASARIAMVGGPSSPSVAMAGRTSSRRAIATSPWPARPAAETRARAAAESRARGTTTCSEGHPVDRGRRAAAGERRAATAAPQLRARSVAPSVLPSSGTHASAPAGRPPRLPAHHGFNTAPPPKCSIEC
jgi:hypothetical protein